MNLEIEIDFGFYAFFLMAFSYFVFSTYIGFDV